MKISDRGLNFIEKREGYSLKVYKDSAGLKTVGVGHLITGKEKPPIYNVITPQYCSFLLRQDSQIAVDAVNTLVKTLLSQAEFDALVSLVFNIGVGAFTKSTLLKLLNSGQRKTAASQFLVWNRAGGQINQGLINRRNKEYKLFTAGIYE
jgi:lysozyme